MLFAARGSFSRGWRAVEKFWRSSGGRVWLRVVLQAQFVLEAIRGRTAPRGSESSPGGPLDGIAAVKIVAVKIVAVGIAAVKIGGGGSINAVGRTVVVGSPAVSARMDGERHRPRGVGAHPESSSGQAVRQSSLQK